MSKVTWQGGALVAPTVGIGKATAKVNGQVAVLAELTFAIDSQS